MLNALKQEANYTRTENGALTHLGTQSDVLDFFAAAGALRHASEDDICTRFFRAYAEDKDLAMKTLFFARDIRGGLGERRTFRILLRRLAAVYPQSVRRNLRLIAEYGRFDDLLVLIGTGCEQDALDVIREQLALDLAAMERGESVSLLAKWLPSVNTSNKTAVALARRIACALGMKDAAYRRTLSSLRRHIGVLEKHLREKKYDFDYAAQCAKAMFRYRNAFLRNDAERYGAFLQAVSEGKRKLHTGTLYPYEIVQPILEETFTEDVEPLSAQARAAIDATWNALENFAGEENALVVVDGSGSMYAYANPMPIAVALSLGIYFAERNRGAFHNHFITFSESPRMVEIKGEDIFDKVLYCASFDEIANTDIQAVFELVLQTAVNNRIAQEELPQTIYIISDMEFDRCAESGDMTNFAYAKQLFAQHGYTLPQIVFWNVSARHTQMPVTKNEQGVVLVSGCTPQILDLMDGSVPDPYAFMMRVLERERYAAIAA
ncbi:MAG: DUF2828 family protein [Lachnospiraceae bacterium]|nr:DUF2828 family protein [Lachnospiraceae bacterium]